MQGIIINNISNKYIVKTKVGIYNCNARGKLKKDDITPVVGDFVEIHAIDEDKKEGIIDEILPRKNYIKRPKISNLSQILLVVSSKLPNPDLLMLDKQIAFAEFLEIKPIIIVNKIDLDNKELSEKIETLYTNIGYTVISTNAKTGEGINKIRKILKNKTSAFSGNSGVGKSTLLNCIFKENVTEEGEVSKKSKRGKNTTTNITLYEVEDETYVADTPGFSTFEIYEISSNELAKYFIEFREYMNKCRYVGCNHIKEEECGIKLAVQEGLISKERYDRFVKIYYDIKDKEEHRW